MTESAPEPAEQPAVDDQLAKDVEEAVAACDGDARATVGALLVAYRMLEEEHEKLKQQVSKGFGRAVPLARLKEVQG